MRVFYPFFIDMPTHAISQVYRQFILNGSTTNRYYAICRGELDISFLKDKNDLTCINTKETKHLWVRRMKILRFLMRKFDIIHTCELSFWYRISKRMIMLSNLRNPKVKQLASLQCAPSEHPELRRSQMEAIESAHLVITVSKYMQRVVKEEHGIDSRVIYNGIDSQFFSPDYRSDSLIKEYDLSNPFFLFVGRFIDRKRPDLVLKVASNCRDIDFVLIGSGELEKDLLEYKRERNLQNVKFLGTFDREILRSFYASSYALLFPTEDEPCSLAMLEAIACGTPFIGVESGATPEIVRHTENGLIANPGDVNQLTEYVRYLADNPAERDRMGKSARQRAMEFDWIKTTKQYEDAYEELLGNKGL